MSDYKYSSNFVQQLTGGGITVQGKQITSPGPIPEGDYIARLTEKPYILVYKDDPKVSVVFVLEIEEALSENADNKKAVGRVLRDVIYFSAPLTDTEQPHYAIRADNLVTRLGLLSGQELEGPQDLSIQGAQTTYKGPNTQVAGQYVITNYGQEGALIQIRVTHNVVKRTNRQTGNMETKVYPNVYWNAVVEESPSTDSVDLKDLFKD